MHISHANKKIVIGNLLKGEDYRIIVVDAINCVFLEFAIEFLKKVVAAKFINKEIDLDWYKKTFLDKNLPKEDIATNSGLNMKTVENMRNSTKKEVVVELADESIDKVHLLINELIENNSEIDLKLTIKFKGVSVDLNINESLVVINAIAVKRASIRGGVWSEVGKRVERPLMETLCKLYSVPKENYDYKIEKQEKNVTDREVDFYLINEGRQYKCEVKLMGKGNPESADGAIARGVDVFVADKLSDKGKKIADKKNMQWLELRSKGGFKKFREILENLNVPHKDLVGDPDNLVAAILDADLSLRD